MDKHGLQCGFCTPGMIMAAADLLARNPNPSDEEIRHGLEGNLCRCTGYHNIVEAVKSAAGLGGDGMSAIGESMRRKEDPRMITGRGRYTEDINLPGMLHAVVVRSPEAHATITSIDASAATEREGVVAVLTGEDMAGDFAGPLPMVWAPPGVEIKTPEHWPLKRGQVKHVGDPVAVVVATSRHLAVDAAEDVIVDYDPKPAVVDPEAALESGSALVWDDFGTNRTHEWTVGGGDVDAGMAEAEVSVEHRFVNHRTSGAPIEPRCSIGEIRGDKLTLYSTTQIPHIARFVFSGMLGIPEDQLRVVAPDVGGGFGAKLQTYGEEVLVLALAKRLGRPVKWVETRSEHMTTSHHGRDQINYVTLGAKSDGTITALKVRIIADLGAYQQLLTPFIPDARLPGDGRLLPDPEHRPALHGRVHEQDGHRRDPRSGPAGGHLLDRADDGPAR